jgi:methyl-accepting chemotaxis protein
MKMSLRKKILFSVGLIIVVVLGSSTIVYIQNLQRDYKEAINFRSEALAQSIVENILSRVPKFAAGTSQPDPAEINAVLQTSVLQCAKIYELNKEKGVAFIAVINAFGIIVAHNDSEQWGTSVESQILQTSLQRHDQLTVLDSTIYHTLVPLFTEDGQYLGTIDIGSPKAIVETKIQTLIRQTVVLFVLLLLIAFFAVSVFVHLVLIKPIRQLVTFGQQLAEGELIHQIPFQERDDEVATLSRAFKNISLYLHDVASMAAQIADGVIAGDVRIRSPRDVLGHTMDGMLNYLKYIASIATNVSEGDLTESIQVRSGTDAFGRVIQAMTEGLRGLIIQIRTSAEQISVTEETISSLAARDIAIVQDVHASAETMKSTLQEMSVSVEEVANNMTTLSSSVEMTSASVSQVTSSIAHIAAHTTELTQQTQETIAYLEKAVQSLEEVVKSTDVSKQLSQDTIQDALAGQEAVEQVTNSMEKIQDTITTAVESITQFAHRSQDIDTILDVIREITEQTSLLALNASIIAAQAGAHGRGFAVVADEIRNLASGVGTSTKDIAAIVQTLQHDTNTVVQTIHEGAADVKQGMERTQQARETLQKIISSARRSSHVVTESANTLHELMTANRTVSNAMERVYTMTGDITASTTQQEASTRLINEAIEQINDMASQIQRSTAEQLQGVLVTVYILLSLRDSTVNGRAVTRSPACPYSNGACHNAC